MNKSILRGLAIVMVSMIVTACDSGENYAPVVDVAMIETMPKSGVHRVAAGETVYEIAWRYGLDYRYLAARNHIAPPYTIHVGQLLSLRGGAVVTMTPPTNSSEAISPANKQNIVEREPNYSTANWIWPVRGKVINGFSNSNKGLNIGGKAGESVYAAGAGKVVYAGDGLRGYGNLIIIKHNSIYLSAYAYNQHLFVKEGQWVRQGQQIAAMGQSASGKTMLHFEIRKAGKPINPLPLLSS